MCAILVGLGGAWPTKGGHEQDVRYFLSVRLVALGIPWAIKAWNGAGGMLSAMVILVGLGNAWPIKAWRERNVLSPFFFVRVAVFWGR